MVGIYHFLLTLFLAALVACGNGPETLYRGDSRDPDTIRKAGGFDSWAKTNGVTPNYDINYHTFPPKLSPPDDGYVSTSSDQKVPQRFLAIQAKKNKNSEGYVYHIDGKHQDGTDVNAAIGKPHKYDKQMEHAVKDHIPWDQVKSYDHYSGGKLIKSQDNPEYVCKRGADGPACVWKPKTAPKKDDPRKENAKTPAGKAGSKTPAGKAGSRSPAHKTGGKTTAGKAGSGKNVHSGVKKPHSGKSTGKTQRAGAKTHTAHTKAPGAHTKTPKVGSHKLNSGKGLPHKTNGNKVGIHKPSAQKTSVKRPGTQPRPKTPTKAGNIAKGASKIGKTKSPVQGVKKAGAAVKDVKKAGTAAKDVKKAGSVAKDVKKAGSVAKDVKKAGTVAKDVKKAATVAKTASKILKVL